jgi:hypothetical protein
VNGPILARLEQDLRQSLNQPDLLLGDYFDFICGISTGGLIAACLSAGMSMSQIRDFYVNHGSSMFERAKWYMKLHQKYEAEPLALLLQEALSGQLNGPGSIFNPDDPPVELGDPRLRGLGMLGCATTAATLPGQCATTHWRNTINSIARIATYACRSGDW